MDSRSAAEDSMVPTGGNISAGFRLWIGLLTANTDLPAEESMKPHLPASFPGLIVAVAVLAFPSGLACQQPVVLTHVNVIDGTGAAAKPDRTVTIAGDRIRSISESKRPSPANTSVIDMHGMTIMPLIINTHGHLGLTKGTSVSAANETDENLRHQLLRYEMYGVGAMLSMGTDGQKFAEIRQESRD